MNPTDDNQNQGAPAPSAPMAGGEPTPAASSEPNMGSETPQMGANCHCGKPSQNGMCTGCSAEEANCTCPPAESNPAPAV